MDQPTELPTMGSDDSVTRLPDNFRTLSDGGSLPMKPEEKEIFEKVGNVVYNLFLGD